MNSKIHSAAHIIDMAMVRAKKDFTPSEGHHFPTGPYVVYIGKVPVNEKKKLIKDLNTHCKDIIEEATKDKR